jgi:tetrapyrrole methylase family protein/MazG family protein/ATP diphosphatase
MQQNNNAGRGVDSKLASAALNRLLTVMQRLRDPETGCPWDIEQSFATIAPYTIEEAYEVADAISRGDSEDLREELGDLLLQVVYHAQIASELGLFTFADVAEGISEKMIRRHPHVFASSDRKVEDHAKNWNIIKKSEREEKARQRGAEPLTAGTGETAALFADIPLGLPALQRSAKLHKQAARFGFDWPDVRSIALKAEEEWEELKAEVPVLRDANGDTQHNTEKLYSSHNQDDGLGNRERIEEELGDLFFVLVNLGLRLGVDPESALRGANVKFVNRITAMAEMAGSQGKNLQDYNLNGLEALWNAAKKAEAAGRNRG